MRKQIIENAAYEIATQVRTVEESIDSALAEIAELQARIMRGNSVAGVGFGTVHPTLQQLAAAVTGLVETRGAIVECHKALADARAMSRGFGPSAGAMPRNARRSPTPTFELSPEAI